MRATYKIPQPSITKSTLKIYLSQISFKSHTGQRVDMTITYCEIPLHHTPLDRLHSQRMCPLHCGSHISWPMPFRNTSFIAVIWLKGKMTSQIVEFLCISKLFSKTCVSISSNKIVRNFTVTVSGLLVHLSGAQGDKNVHMRQLVEAFWHTTLHPPI